MTETRYLTYWRELAEALKQVGIIADVPARLVNDLHHEGKTIAQAVEIVRDKQLPPARPLSVIAREARADLIRQGRDGVWMQKYYSMIPFLNAMLELNSIEDKYYADTGVSMVRYFLSNSAQWRGDVARKIKIELRMMLSLHDKG